VRTKTLLLAWLLLAPGAFAQDPAADFRVNCMSCHTIGGGRLTGPDLKDVETRKDRAWLIEFMQNPKRMIDAGDPYALRLRDEARGVIMPTIPGMNKERAAALLSLIAAESKLERSQFAGFTVPDRPFTAEEIAQGERLFSGRARLANGGPPCLSCHGVAGLGSLGGGRLGPDLTLAYERLGGRKGLAQWLAAPATPTMQLLFTAHPLAPEEVLEVTAFLERSAQRGGAVALATPLDFFFLGLGGAALALGVFGRLWAFRFRAVRQPLVRQADLAR